MIRPSRKIASEIFGSLIQSYKPGRDGDARQGAVLRRLSPLALPELSFFSHLAPSALGHSSLTSTENELVDGWHCSDSFSAGHGIAGQHIRGI